MKKNIYIAVIFAGLTACHSNTTATPPVSPAEDSIRKQDAIEDSLNKSKVLNAVDTLKQAVRDARDSAVKKADAIGDSAKRAIHKAENAAANTISEGANALKEKVNR